MKIIEVLNVLERFTPLPLQADYDNTGLQAGLTEVELPEASLCLDATEQAADEAVALRYNLIVTHHPLVFRRLSYVSDQSYVQRTVMKAIRHNVVIVAIHTNLDSAKGGMNYKIAEKMGLQNLSFIDKTQLADGVEGGEGVVGSFAEPMAANNFITIPKRKFDVGCVQVNQPLRRPIRTVVMYGGSGSFLLKDALQAGADAFMTGEIGYYEFFDMEQRIQLAVVGCYQSEQYIIELLKQVIEEQCPGAECHLTSINTDPIICL